MFDPDHWSAVPFHFWTVMFFIFGSIVGSFLNVCIYRIPIGENIVFPPSHCPHCKYHIPWYLNIPIFTWIFLRGRCANCGAPISVRYLIVEAMTGILFVLAWLCVGHSSVVLAVIYSLVMAALIVASFIDCEHFVIPDVLTLGGVACGFILSFIFPVLHFTTSPKIALQESIWGIIAGGGILYAISRVGKVFFGQYKQSVEEGKKVILSESAIEIGEEKIPYEEIFYRASDKVLISAQSVELTLLPKVKEEDKEEAKEEVPEAEDTPLHWENVDVELSADCLKIGEESWNPSEVKRVEVSAPEVTLPREVMGLGDVKLMAAVGAFLGWKSVIFTLFASSLIGSIVGVVLILSGKHELSSRLPYGPYIAVGTILWMMGGYYYVTKWVEELFSVLL